MKNWIRKIGLVLMMLLVTGLLTACSAGSSVDTTLTINDDLSGTRAMNLVIDQSVFDEYFTGTIEDLNAAITEGCPAELTWVYDDSTGVKNYTFTLTFSSPEDYKTKVDTIIGEESDVEIIMSKSDSVWANGVLVDESFSSADLLYWLRELVVEKGFVSSSNSSDIFALRDNTILFAGEEYSCTSNAIYVNKIEYLDIDSIDMLTDAKVYDCYDKTIVISIPELSMEKKGEEITAWLEERVPNGAKGEWTTEGTDSVYTVSKEDMTAEQLEAFLNEFFDTDTCSVTQEDIRENMSPFSFNIGLIEIVDFSNYVIGDQVYHTDINYYVKGENGYVGGSDLSDLSRYEESDYSDAQYEGYRYGAEDYREGALRFYSSFFQKLYRVDEVTVETNIGFLGGLSRSSSFVLDAIPTDEEKACILEKINALGVAYDAQKAQEDGTEDGEPTTETEPSTESVAPQWKVKISEKTSDDTYSIILKQSGSRDEIKASSEALFGSEGEIYTVKDFSIFKVKYEVAVCDEFSLGDFVDYTTEEVDARYVLHTGFGSDIEFANIDEARTDGSEVTLKEDVLNGVAMVCYGTQLNLWAVFFYLFIVIALASIVIAVLKSGIVKGIIEKMNAKKAEKPQAPVQVQEAPQQEAPQQEAPQQETPQEEIRFCGNCGAKYKAGAGFCPECGSKLES